MTTERATDPAGALFCWSLLRGHLEERGSRSSLIDLDSTPSDRELTMLRHELSTRRERQVAFRGPRRYVERVGVVGSGGQAQDVPRLLVVGDPTVEGAVNAPVDAVASIGWLRDPAEPAEMPRFKEQLRAVRALADRVGAAHAVAVVEPGERNPSTDAIPRPLALEPSTPNRNVPLTVVYTLPGTRDVPAAVARSLGEVHGFPGAMTLVPTAAISTLLARAPVAAARPIASPVRLPTSPRERMPTESPVSEGLESPFKRLLRDDDVTRDELLRCDTAVQHAKVVGFIQAVAARALGMPAEQVDMDRPLTDAGLDSSVTAEVRTVIERRLRIRIPMAELMKGPTGREFASTVVLLFADTCVPA